MGIALWTEPIAARFREFLDQRFGSQFGKIVPKRSQTVLVGGHLQSGQNVGIKLSRRKGAPAAM